MTRRLAIEQWSPEYGSPLDADGLDPTTAKVDVDVEVAGDAWAPVRVDVERATCVLFVDGVRRVDALAWVTADDGTVAPALLASYAAGVVRCNGGLAELAAVRIGRALCTADAEAVPLTTAHDTWHVRHASSSTNDDLSIALQTAMGELEGQVVAAVAPGADLVVVDGPLRAQVGYPSCSVGYVKTHAVGYLDQPQVGVLATLQPGERTPLFLIPRTVRSEKYSWYARLPGAVGHPWAGVVRCEIDAVGRSVATAVAMADLCTSTLPRFASRRHKDPRAPQNLVPIGGLEQRLRHLLGDRDLLYRGMLRAAS